MYRSCFPINGIAKCFRVSELVAIDLPKLPRPRARDRSRVTGREGETGNRRDGIHKNSYLRFQLFSSRKDYQRCGTDPSKRTIDSAASF